MRRTDDVSWRWRDGAECPAIGPVDVPEALVARDGKYVVPKRLGPFHSKE